MSTPDPLLGILTRALEAHQFADADTCACGVEYDGPVTFERHQAEVYLDAIAATGRLLPHGMVTHTQWGSRIREPGIPDWHIDWPDEQMAREDVADRQRDGQDATLARRTRVRDQTGPWEVVQP